MEKASQLGSPREPLPRAFPRRRNGTWRRSNYIIHLDNNNCTGGGTDNNNDNIDNNYTDDDDDDDNANDSRDNDRVNMSPRCRLAARNKGIRRAHKYSSKAIPLDGAHA